MAGYSGTPLATKLGIKPGHRVCLLSAPDGFEAVLAGLPDGVDLLAALDHHLDVIVTFHTERTRLADELAGLLAALRPDGSLWVAWPKRASNVPTDVTEHTIRELALPTGLVDNKVCAIDATWSGLRLVLRKELRAGRTTAAG